MLNIEGTPHEKALLVISSYIIGFVSAYIAFTYAFPVNGVQPTVTYVPMPPTQTATVVDSQTAAVPEDDAPTAAVVDVVYENQGLYLYGLADEPVLLSKHAEAVNVTHTSDMTLTEKQGIHSAMPAYEYFADHELVYFCESYEDEESCVPYIYDLANTNLQVVQANESPITVPMQAAQDARVDSAGVLRIGEYTSTNPSEPWMVAGR